MTPPTDEDRRARHAWLTFPGTEVLPTALPVPRPEGDRIADTRAALRDARDAAVRAYRDGAAGRRVSLDVLHATLASIAAAQTALDGEAPRRQIAPRPARPLWADCRRFPNGAPR